MKKSTFVAAACIVIAIGMLVVVIVYPQQIRDFFHNISTWIRDIFREGEEGPSNQGNGDLAP